LPPPPALFSPSTSASTSPSPAFYTGDPAAATFLSFPTDRDHLQKLFAKHRPAAVVIEACLLAGWVHDLCHELGLPCHVANTAPTSEEPVAPARSLVDPSVTH